MWPDPLHVASGSTFTAVWTAVIVMSPGVHDFNVHHNMIETVFEKKLKLLFKTADVSSARPNQMQGNEQSLPRHGACLLYSTSRLLIRYCRRHISLKRIELNLCKEHQEQKN